MGLFCQFLTLSRVFCSPCPVSLLLSFALCFYLSLLPGLDSCPISYPTSAYPRLGRSGGLQGNFGWGGPRLSPWPNLRKLLVTQIWESMGSTGPRERAGGAPGLPYGSSTRVVAAHSPHCNLKTLDSPPGLVSHTLACWEVSGRSGNPGFLSSFSTLPGRHQVHWLLRTPTREVYRVSFREHLF